MDSSAALIRYDAARMALAECARINDAADIRDKAAALAASERYFAQAPATNGRCSPRTRQRGQASAAMRRVAQGP